MEKVLELEAEKNSLYLCYYEVGQGQTLLPLVIWMTEFLNSAYFGQLRTEEQLGYIVSSKTENKSEVLHMGFMVQSDTKEPNYIHGRTIDFLEKSKKRVDDLKNEEFEKIRNSIAKNFEEDFKNIGQLSNSHWVQISRCTYDWDLLERIRQFTLDLKIEDVKKFFYGVFYENTKVFELHL